MRLGDADAERISSAIECLLHPQDADDSDMTKAINTAVRAMRLLKAQEPRVMTLEEVKSSVGNDMYLEISTRTDETPYITAATLDSAGQKGVVFYCDHFNFVAYNRRLYGWRCWTSRPDEKMRAETPWQ